MATLRSVAPRLRAGPLSSTTFAKNKIKWSLNQMKQIPFAILEEQDASAAARGLSRFIKNHAAAVQFSARGFNGVHAHRQMPPAGELVVAGRVHARVTRIDF